jgi:hypothetical protein
VSLNDKQWIFRSNAGVAAVLPLVGVWLAGGAAGRGVWHSVL